MIWEGWPLSRALVLFTGLAFLVISLQVYLFHSRQNFRTWVMWGPVIEGPIIGALAIGLVLLKIPPLATAFTILTGIAVAAGLIGFYFHFSGVGERVGGYKINNFLLGPPVMLPIMFSALGVLGLLALHWRF